MYRFASIFVLSLTSACVFAAEQSEKNIDINFSSEIFATRNGAVVTHHDMDAYMQRIPERDRAGVLSDPERIGKIVEDLMLQRSIYNDAPADELLDDSLTSAQIYQAALILAGEKRIRQVIDEAKLDSYESRGRELYLADPEQFARPRTADFTHLIISTNDKSDVEAIRKIDEVLSDMENGMSFDEAVMKYSDDPSKSENKGSFSGQSRNSLDTAFANVLFELDPGDISEPVRTPYGWHLIRLDSLHDGKVPEYEEIKSEATRLARQKHTSRIRNEYLESMSLGDLEIKPGAVEKLLERYPPPEAYGDTPEE